MSDKKTNPSGKKDEIRIRDRKVGLSQSPFVVAEMSGNHNQSLERALAIVEAAARAGVEALKIQTYTADTMTLDVSEGEFRVNDPKSLWAGKSLYQLYQEAHTPWEWHPTIFDRCRKLGLIGFSTPFDVSSVDFLESLGVPCYKIASFENTDLPLIRRAASTRKPLIISTGMATLEELEETLETAREAGCQDLILLKCTSCYPAPPKALNLQTLPDLRKRFGVEVGISDHAVGIGASIAAVGLGATVIEKHFTLKRSDGGVDSAFSIEPEEMKKLVEESTRAWEALGQVTYGPTPEEKTSLLYRRSIYTVKEIKAGEVFTRENIRIIRPALGLAPKHYDHILGKKASRAIPRGKPIQWEFIETLKSTEEATGKVGAKSRV